MQLHLGKLLIRVFILEGTEVKPIGYVICDTWYPLTLWRKKSKKGYAGKNIIYVIA